MRREGDDDETNLDQFDLTDMSYAEALEAFEQGEEAHVPVLTTPSWKIEWSSGSEDRIRKFTQRSISPTRTWRVTDRANTSSEEHLAPS